MFIPNSFNFIKFMFTELGKFLPTFQVPFNSDGKFDAIQIVCGQDMYMVFYDKTGRMIRVITNEQLNEPLSISIHYSEGCIRLYEERGDGDSLIWSLFDNIIEVCDIANGECQCYEQKDDKWDPLYDCDPEYDMSTRGKIIMVRGEHDDNDKEGDVWDVDDELNITDHLSWAYHEKIKYDDKKRIASKEFQLFNDDKTIKCTEVATYSYIHNAAGNIAEMIIHRENVTTEISCVDHYWYTYLKLGRVL